MALRIEDYALIGDTQTAALVGNDGSIDWLCLPRFDSDACFAALVGDERQGRWRIAPEGRVKRVSRRYRAGTLILETDLATDDGVLQLVDCMPPRDEIPDVVRLARCLEGRVAVRMELIPRLGYGRTLPWIFRRDGCVHAIAGPNGLSLRTGVATRTEGAALHAAFTLDAGDEVSFLLAWYPSHRPPPPPLDAGAAIESTESFWREWCARFRYDGGWRVEVQDSLVTLKALTYLPTGGIVAAPTTSLPERLGGVRNWDYRYCWLRDATFCLYALMGAGYRDEAIAWRDWLLRAAAGDPAQLQVMYGVAGERWLDEQELPWFAGYQGSRPVRIGNAACQQFQLDVFGEVMDCMHQARRIGVEPQESSWALQRHLMEFLESNWERPDQGIWEVRGPHRQFTHSKVMAWVAFDRAVKAVERFGHQGPVERWRRLRALIHGEVCRQGYDPGRRAFVQAFGSRDLDASLLMIPLVGFLPPDDERVRNTVETIERELCEHGFVRRYRNDGVVDGLPPGEGVFLPCTFWLADNLVLLGRHDDARRLFERLLSLRNDVGLLSEEYDPVARRLLGNFPQAFTHVSLVNTAHHLSQPVGPLHRRQ